MRGCKSTKILNIRGKMDKEKTTTWFFADSTMDGGDICEQEIIKIDYTLRPRMFYEQHIIPAMQRTLERCLNGIQKGFIRRVPQVKEYATFDFKEKNL